MPLDNDEVLKVARLARLALAPEELRVYREQLERVLAHMDELSAVDTRGVEPLGHASGLDSGLRADEPREWEGAETLLAAAPAREENFFKVPKVIE